MSPSKWEQIKGYYQLQKKLNIVQKKCIWKTKSGNNILYSTETNIYVDIIITAPNNI